MGVSFFSELTSDWDERGQSNQKNNVLVNKFSPVLTVQWCGEGWSIQLNNVIDFSVTKPVFGDSFSLSAQNWDQNVHIPTLSEKTRTELRDRK